MYKLRKKFNFLFNLIIYKLFNLFINLIIYIYKYILLLFK